MRGLIAVMRTVLNAPFDALFFTLRHICLKFNHLIKFYAKKGEKSKHCLLDLQKCGSICTNLPAQSDINVPPPPQRITTTFCEIAKLDVNSLTILAIFG